MRERPFSSSYDAATCTLSVVGAVDADHESDLDSALVDAVKDAVDRGRLATVDLSEIDFFPSSALGVLIDATRRAAGAEAGRSYVLVARPGTVAARVLDLCGLPHRPDRP